MNARLSHILFLAGAGLSIVAVLEAWRPGVVGGVVNLGFVWLAVLAVIGLASWVAHDGPRD